MPTLDTCPDRTRPYNEAITRSADFARLIAFCTSNTVERSSRTTVSTFTPARLSLDTNGFAIQFRSSPFVTHEGDCVLRDLSRERHHVFAADDTIDRID